MSKFISKVSSMDTFRGVTGHNGKMSPGLKSLVDVQSLPCALLQTEDKQRGQQGEMEKTCAFKQGPDSSM